MPKIKEKIIEFMKPEKCHLSDKGYLFRIINYKRVYLHRFIVECYLGRKLKDNEIVHHKDGNILNNNIKNLEVTTQSIHFSKHLKGNKYYKLRIHNHGAYSKGIIGKIYKKKKQLRVVKGKPGGEENS